MTTFATYVLAATIANTSYGSTKTYHAVFTDVAGLHGRRRRAHRRRPGRHGQRHQDHRSTTTASQVAHHFTVIKSRPLPKSTSPSCATATWSGSATSTSSQGAGDPNDLLKSGGTIPVSQTHPAARPDLPVQRVPAAVPGPGRDQINELSDRAHPDVAGRGRQPRAAADEPCRPDQRHRRQGRRSSAASSTTWRRADRRRRPRHRAVEPDRPAAAFISGLAQDRDDHRQLDRQHQLAGHHHADLLTQIRPPLAKDITDLTALTANLNKNSGDVASFLQLLPNTVGALIRTGSYGSWFNFYLCSVSGHRSIPLPLGDRYRRSA